MTLYERLRRLDERIMDSPVGWLLPGGLSYRLGRRDRGTNDRSSPYVVGTLLQGPVRGLLTGWNWNAGRARGDGPRYWQRCVDVAKRGEPFVSPAAAREVRRLVDSSEPQEGLRALAWAIVNEDVAVPGELIDDIRTLTNGLITDRFMPPNLDEHRAEDDM